MATGMTDQKTNKAVAKRLGLEYRIEHGRTLTMAMNRHNIERAFEPATDPAAAKFASEALGRDFFLTYDSKTELWGAAVEADDRSYGTFCQAICAAILGTSA